MTQVRQLALFLADSPASAPPALALVVAPVERAEPLSLADRVKAWLLEQHRLGTAPVKFHDIMNAFETETASDLDVAAHPFEIGHDDAPNTYEAT